MSGRIVLGVVGAVFPLWACASMAEAARAPVVACPAVASASFRLNVIREFRVYTDPATGDSRLERRDVAATLTPLLKTGKVLKEFNLGGAKRVQIIVGPPNLELPLHPAPYAERFLVLAGTTDLRVADGSHVELRPGDMVTFEDTASKSGHGGHIGPCGYVDLDIVPK